ncbi:hypothetical protein LB565_16970 [Mesorhizobium sp. CA14]|uniref:hypothetical protein n=1 Tax=Mesorhizobium sp. CA14 TaxID=2876642 RepID=UPI001CC8FE81|nr:hypothetical protein [Mesorhizobium sp. CA14]MBZ9849679.1 hypothetical protein [Mesorhizobium sp. CA14]
MDEIADAVLAKLKRAGLVSGQLGDFSTLGGTNAVASAIAARLAHGIYPNKSPRGRTVSEGMMRLASAVSYKLGKANDPKTISFNKVASEVAKALYEARGGKTGYEGHPGPGEPIGVHSEINARRGKVGD